MKKQYHEEGECSTKVIGGVISEVLYLPEKREDKDQALCKGKDTKMECVNESVSNPNIEKPNQAESKYRFIKRNCRDPHY